MRAQITQLFVFHKLFAEFEEGLLPTDMRTLNARRIGYLSWFHAPAKGACYGLRLAPMTPAISAPGVR